MSSYTFLTVWHFVTWAAKDQEAGTSVHNRTGGKMSFRRNHYRWFDPGSSSWPHWPYTPAATCKSSQLPVEPREPIQTLCRGFTHFGWIQTSLCMGPERPTALRPTQAIHIKEGGNCFCEPARSWSFSATECCTIDGLCRWTFSFSWVFVTLTM